MIPHTREVTTLSEKGVGASVNLENDIIGKYVGKLMSFDKDESSSRKELSMDTLISNGFI